PPRHSSVCPSPATARRRGRREAGPRSDWFSRAPRPRRDPCPIAWRRPAAPPWAPRTRRRWGCRSGPSPLHRGGSRSGPARPGPRPRPWGRRWRGPRSRDRGQVLRELVVALRDSGRHRSGEDAVARFLRFVEHRHRDRRAAAFLHEGRGVDGFARVPRIVELLGGHDPLRRDDLAEDAAHSHVVALGPPPDVTILSPDPEVDLADGHRPARAHAEPA